MSKVAIWVTNFATAGSDNERNLPKCLESILTQSFTDWTCYVFDNHSPSPAVHQLLADAAAKDSRVVLVDVPKGLAGIPMARWAWRFLSEKSHDYSITIGGHDYWNSADFLKIMVERMDAELAARGPTGVSLLYCDVWQVDGPGNILGRFQNIMQVGQVTRAFIPQYVVTGVDSPQYFGLWNEAVRRKLPIRYECGGFDHLIVMHAALRGMIAFEGRAVLVMRAPPPGDGPDKYGSRHFAADNLARGQQDFIDQIEWCLHCVNEAIADLPPDAKPTFRMMLTASMVASYMSLRGTNLQQIPGAYQQFTSNPLVMEMMKGCHHTTRFADALIRNAKPFT